MDYVTPIINASSSIRAKGDLSARQTATFRTYEDPNDEMHVVYTPINGLKLTAGFPSKSYYVIGYLQIVGSGGYYLCSDVSQSNDVLSNLFWVDNTGRRDAWTKRSENDDMLLMAVFKNDKTALRRAVNKAIR